MRKAIVVVAALALATAVARAQDPKKLGLDNPSNASPKIAADAKATNGVFHLVVAPAGPGNPRNSEADIIELKDGRLLLGWSEYYGSNTSDHGAARISGKISTDGGRSWGEKYTLVENDALNVMEVNFVRLASGDLGLLYLKKNSLSDWRAMFRVSQDEGRTFGPASMIGNRTIVLCNGRARKLRTGRLLLPAASICLLSDDDGKTWRQSKSIQSPAGCEPVCIELKDGRLMILLRTAAGCQYKSISTDQGETWSASVPTPLTGTDAPASLSRIPTTGDLLVIWNHNPGRKTRNPLTAAVSKDEGETWQHFRNLEEGPNDQWAYPAVTWVGDRALVTYFNYKGGISLQLKSLPAAWFYE